MRWDVHDRDARWVCHPAVLVLLDGVEVRGVRQFDTDEGWVERLVLDADDRAQLEGRVEVVVVVAP